VRRIYSLSHKSLIQLKCDSLCGCCSGTHIACGCWSLNTCADSGSTAKPITGSCWLISWPTYAESRTVKCRYCALSCDRPVILKNSRHSGNSVSGCGDREGQSMSKQTLSNDKKRGKKCT